MDGKTALICAIEKGNIVVVRLLIEHGADVKIKDEKYSRSPVYYAAEQGFCDILELLIKHGAKEDINSKDTYGYTPLCAAVRRNSLSAVKLLIQNGSKKV